METNYFLDYIDLRMKSKNVDILNFRGIGYWIRKM